MVESVKAAADVHAISGTVTGGEPGRRRRPGKRQPRRHAAWLFKMKPGQRRRPPGCSNRRLPGRADA